MVIESDEEDLSPVLDLTLRKRKKQPKVFEASSQPQAKISRVIKRPATLSILEPTPEELSKIATTQVGSDNSSLGVEGDKVKAYMTFLLSILLTSNTLTNLSLDFGFQGATTQTVAKSPYVPVLLNSASEPTYHPTFVRGSEKRSMSKINQPIIEEHQTSPPKITTQHSHTNDSDHEIDLSREAQTKANNDDMAVDEEVHDFEGGWPNVDGTNIIALGGDDAQDEELR